MAAFAIARARRNQWFLEYVVRPSCNELSCLLAEVLGLSLNDTLSKLLQYSAEGAEIISGRVGYDNGAGNNVVMHG